MKNILLKKSNKGVAMISVMIAIAFVSVIATTMLYTSSSNYAMKAANVRSKENFYATDGELVKVSSSIRNKAFAAGGDPNAYMDTLKVGGTDAAIKDKIDCRKIAKEVYPSATIKGTYNDAYILETGTNDQIHFSSDSCTLEKQTTVKDKAGNTMGGVTRYILHDFTVYQDNKSGLHNSAKSDIYFDVYKSTTPAGGSGGVGNMSLLLDANIDTTDNAFPSLTMTGNTYISDYDGTTTWNGGTYSVPGSNAVYMSSESRLNFSGDYNIVYGDIHLTGDSSMCVNGDLVVYGDIFISDDATLILSGNGKLSMMKDALPGRTVASKINFEGSASAAHNVWPADLESKIARVDKDKFADFCAYLNLNDADEDNDGLLKKILKPVDIAGATRYVTDIPASVNINGGDNISKLTKYESDGLMGYKLNSSNLFYGKSIGYALISPSKSGNLNGGHENLLIISPCSSTITMTQKNPYSTTISNKPLSYGIEHGVVLSKLGTNEFNYITAAKGDADSTIYNNSSNPFNNITINFSEGGSYSGAVGDFFQQNCNKYVDETFNKAGGTGSSGSDSYASTIYFKEYVRDGK